MSRSNFPGGVDVFQELFDLPYNKIQDATRLTNLKMKQTLTNDEQNEVIRLSAELRDYMITPESMNKFQDALTAVEQFFYDEVDGYIDDKQALWKTYVEAFKHIGYWTTGKAYKFQNMVVNKENGNLYLCKKNHTATAANKPVADASTYWVQVSSKGDKGDPGLTGILKGEWDSTTGYKIGDAVVYDRKSYNPPITYIALRDNTNKNPYDNPLDWLLLDRLSSGKTLPVTNAPGAHFVQFV